MFLATFGEEAHDVYDGLKFDCKEHKIDLGIVIKKSEEFFEGKMHKAYEVYKFHLRKQRSNRKNQELYNCSVTTCKELQFQAAAR